MLFPFGKAPFALLVTALVSGLAILVTNLLREDAPKPDLVLAVFAPTHARAYREALKDFQAEHQVTIQVQLAERRALQTRLQSAMLAGIDDIPDLVEVERNSFGYYTKGPVEDVGFADLTDKINEEGFLNSMVASRFPLWSSRGRTFGLPHDVHPVGLVYRKDIVEELGIDIDDLETWDDFVRIGREITKDLDGDGLPDRYALEMNTSTTEQLNALILQKGAKLFEADGTLSMNDPKIVDVLVWYVQQIHGPDRIGANIGTSAGSQSVYQAMIEGYVIFYICPDWRTSQIEANAEAVRGKLGIMPLPAWEKGARRTSTWGGTCMSITKACQRKGKFDLAWEVTKYLYTNEESLPNLFQGFNILPPYKGVWDAPEFHAPNEFYSNERIGETFISLAEDTPEYYISPYNELADARLLSAFANTLNYYKKNGPEGIREFAAKQLAEQTKRVQREIDHNPFLAKAEKD